MKISIVVPAFNEEKLIETNLRRIHEARISFDRVGWTSELIVCDNNSTDRTAELAGKAGARVVFEPINQIGRARNAGAAAATGDWLVFIDADSWPSAELFYDLTEAIADGRWVGGGCLVRMEKPLPRMWRGWVACWNAISWTCKWAAGSFVFCETRRFREIGGFDHRLYVAEELDFCRRLKKAARRDRQGLTILTKHRLCTSSRKLTLYSRRELNALFWRSLVQPWQFVRDPQQCFMWYDGRR